MPLSTVLGAQSLVQPAVCTTATRPASPYTGQAIYDTTTATVLVWNGTAWVGTGGLTMLKAETAFSAVTSFNSGTVFSSAYTNYLVKLRYTTTSGDVFVQMSSAGTPATGANYNYQSTGAYGNTTAVIEGADSQTSGRLTSGSVGTFYSSATIDLFSPFVAEPTTISTFGMISEGSYTAAVIKLAYTNHTLSTSYDGFTLLVPTGTMTGTYTVYGYAK
jgi:hypothetical protein